MLARRNLERQPVQDRAIRIVAEHHVVKHDGRLPDQQGWRTRRVFHFDGGVHQLEHLGHVDQALPDRAVDGAQHVERAE